jgi:[ribosomal protein S5]-alanine N-acetyltransferase
VSERSDPAGTTLTSPRLRIVPARIRHVDLELAGGARLAQELDVELPADWPPEHHGAERLRFVRDRLGEPGQAGWWLHYVVYTGGSRPALVGVAGFKGPPVDGVVEIGYSIVPSWHRQGLATEASRVLVEAAWARGCSAVRAHTLPDLEPSIRVLRKLGFTTSEPPEPGVLAFTLRRSG